MTTRHTPGPWVRCRVESHGTDVRSDGAHGVPVAWCGANAIAGNQGSHSIGQMEAAANARLIAAAPDLLAALDRLLASGDVRDAGEAGALKQARAAIAKATGEA